MVCEKCGEPIVPASSAKKLKGKPYHPACLEGAKQALKQAARIKDTAKRKPIDQQELEGYVANAFALPELTPKLRKQLEQFNKEWNCSWSDLMKVARYWFEIVPKHEEYPEPTLGILPYYKEEALHFWEGVDAANEYNIGKTLQDRTVKIHYHSKPRFILPSVRMEDL